jgi:hypothetical protein
MARTLPWLVPEGDDKEDKSSSAKRRPEKRKSPDEHHSSDSSDSSDAFDVEQPTFGPKRRTRKLTQRNQSSSPPPGPPPEEYMISGLEHDDGWVMVEDEFVTTARVLTAHLHHADYQRLKKLSGARAASSFSLVPRLTDGRTKQSMTTQKMVQAKAVRREIMKGVRNVIGSGDEEEENDAYMNDLRLAGLMSQTGATVKLGKFIRSERRGGDGQKRWEENARSLEIDLDETEDDDLDIEQQVMKNKTARVQHTTTSIISRSRGKERGVSYESSLLKSTTKGYSTEKDLKRSASFPEATEATSPVPNLDDFGHLSKRSALPPKLMQKMKSLKEAEMKEHDTRDQTKKKSTSKISDVPTFLL